MKINRQLQEIILRHLTEQFPEPPTDSFYNDLIDKYGNHEVIGTILYLEMHKLLTCKIGDAIGLQVPPILWGLTKPTEKAFDFLADDGGLSTILGTITLKLHSDTIQELLAAKIEQSNIPAEDKSRLKTMLGKMGDAALAKLAEKAIDAIPAAAAVAAIQSIIN